MISYFVSLCNNNIRRKYKTDTKIRKQRSNRIYHTVNKLHVVIRSELNTFQSYNYWYFHFRRSSDTPRHSLTMQSIGGNVLPGVKSSVFEDPFSPVNMLTYTVHGHDAGVGRCFVNMPVTSRRTVLEHQET